MGEYRELTDAEHEEGIRRLRALAERWIQPLGLNQWRIDILYSRNPLAPREDPDARQAHADGWRVFAFNDVQWQYMSACVTVNMPLAVGMDDDELERCFVHEFGHVFVNEMRELITNPAGWRGHEERVVTQLTNAFLWVRSAGRAEGRAEAAAPQEVDGGSGKQVNLTGGQRPQGENQPMEANKDVVAALKELLERAEAGEITAMAAVTVEHDGEVGQSLTNVNEGGNRRLVIFGIEAMRRDVMDGVERLRTANPKLFKAEVK